MSFTKIPNLPNTADLATRKAHFEDVSHIRRMNLELATSEKSLAIFSLAFAYLMLLAQMGTLRLNLSGKRLTDNRKTEIEKQVYKLLTTKLRAWYHETIEKCISEGNTKEYDANRFFKGVVDYKTTVSANTLQTYGFSVSKEELDTFRVVIISLMTEEVASRKYLKSNPKGLSIWAYLKYAADERTAQFKGARMIKGTVTYPEGSMLNYIETVKSTVTSVVDMSTQEDDDTTVYENDRRIVPEDTVKSLQFAIEDYNSFVARYNAKDKNVEKKRPYQLVIPTGLKAKDEFQNWVLLSEDQDMPDTARNILLDALERYQAPRELKSTFIINPDDSVYEAQRVVSSHNWGLNDDFDRVRSDLPFKPATPGFPLISDLLVQLSSFDRVHQSAAD